MKDNWISINDGLPQEYGSYLVAWIPIGASGEDIKRLTSSNLTHYYEILEFDPNENDGWIEEIEQCNKYEILAWMPLPKPYLEVNNER